MAKKIDLTGQRFGKLTVINRLDKKAGTHYYYRCLCDCGKYKDVLGTNLKQGNVRSCGCLRKKELTGQKFGRLTALYPLEERNQYGSIVWHCKCDCGNEIDVPANWLGKYINSCGCLKSLNELKISTMLSSNDIHFIQQYYCNIGQKFYFDFFIENNYMLEYDGPQHFFVSDNIKWSSQVYLKRTHRYDLIKNKYCFKYNIPIIRIPYDAEYTIDDLKLETTHFLLTPENEEIYYLTHGYKEPFIDD